MSNVAGSSKSSPVHSPLLLAKNGNRKLFNPAFGKSTKMKDGYANRKAADAALFVEMTSNICGNLTAGISVALINVPLSISLAVAAQSDPVSGIITAIWAGAFASLIGGSPFNIYGPTGALSGILARYVTRYSVAILPPLAALSAFWGLVAYFLDLYNYLLFLPSFVMHGFSLGVAMIIAMSQINSAMALVVAHVHEMTIMNWFESFNHLASADLRIFSVFFLSWLALFSLIQWKRSIPWSVLIACIGIFLGFLSSTGWIFHLPTLHDKFGDLHAHLYRVPDYSTLVTNFDEFHFGELMIASLSIAFITLLESLISGKIADGMTKTTMNEKNEVLGAAVANLCCAITGGIPATAALARTALNIRSGATTRLAGFSSAIFTILISLVLMPLFSYLPLCVVAALLFQVAVGMIEFKHLTLSYYIDPFSFYLTFVIGVICVVLDPTSALVVGAIIGLLRFARQNSRGFADVVVVDSSKSMAMEGSLQRNHEAMSVALADEQNPVRHRSLSVAAVTNDDDGDEDAKLKIAFYRVVGDLTYITTFTHQSHLQQFFNHRAIILSLRYVNFMDLDGVFSLGKIVAEASSYRCRIVLCSIPPSVKKLVAKDPWFAKEVAKGNVVDTGKIALDMLTNWIVQDMELV